MTRAQHVLWVCALAACWAAGCRTPAPVHSTATPLTPDDLRHFFARARDPRTYWITVYDSDHGPTFKGHNRLHPEQLAMLPFEGPSDRTIPMIKLNAWLGRDFYALIDTTSARNWITQHAFYAMRGVPLGPPAYRFPVVHVNENIPGFAGVLPKLRLDDLHIENAWVCAWAAWGSFRNLGRDVSPSPEVIIGLDLIRSFQFVQLDYPARRVFFSTTFPFRPEADRWLASVPYSEIGGALAVAGSVDGKATTLLIDTAGDFELAATNIALEAIRQLEVGNLVFRNVEMEDASIFELGLKKYPRIGRRLLSRFRVTIDPQARVIHFERPPPRKTSEPEAQR